MHWQVLLSSLGLTLHQSQTMFHQGLQYVYEITTSDNSSKPLKGFMDYPLQGGCLVSSSRTSAIKYFVGEFALNVFKWLSWGRIKRRTNPVGTQATNQIKIILAAMLPVASLGLRLVATRPANWRNYIKMLIKPARSFKLTLAHTNRTLC